MHARYGACDSMQSVHVRFRFAQLTTVYLRVLYVSQVSVAVSSAVFICLAVPWVAEAQSFRGWPASWRVLSSIQVKNVRDRSFM